jgi:ferritin-like protein
MKHAQADYINAGYKYEKAKSPEAGQAAAQAIRTLMESERIEDRADARYLVERGRQEARGVTA